MVDVSIRVSLLNMLARLKTEFDVTFLFITHDLALAKYFAWQGRIVVMYLGRMVEEGPTPRLIATRAILIPKRCWRPCPKPIQSLCAAKRHIELRSAEIPSLLHLPPGCTFHPRCPYFVPGSCDVNVPKLEAIAVGGSVACPIRKDENIQLIAQVD